MAFHTLPQVYDYTSSDQSLLSILQSHLPHSLPLYRRLQFPFRTEHTHVISTISPEDARSKSTNACFAAAYVDRSRRPETEVWLFLSGESGRCPRSTSSQQFEEGDARNDCPNCTSALLSLLQHINALPYPPASGQDPQPANPESATKGYLSHLQDPSVMLIGSVAALPVRTMASFSLIRTDLPGLQYPYIQYTMLISSLPTPRPLPKNLYFAPLRKEHLSITLARTSLPRQLKTLSLLPSMAIYKRASNEQAEDQPVAWAFLGLDASLTSLHVEPEWRGRGFAKAVSVRLFQDKMDFFGAKDDESKGLTCYAHVAPDNAESTGVVKSLGGHGMGEVFWVRVDLRDLGGVVQRWTQGRS